MEQTFPKLRTLTIRDVGKATNSALLFLLPPCGLPITTINIPTNYWTCGAPSAAPVFSQIKKADPTLRLLEIKQPGQCYLPAEKQLTPDLPWAHFQLPRLETLKLDSDCHPRCCLAILSPNLLSLTTLHILTRQKTSQAGSTSWKCKSGEDGPAHSFTLGSLKTLIIKGADDAVHAWMKALDLSTIESLSITFTDIQSKRSEPLSAILASQGTLLRSIDIRGIDKAEQCSIPWREIEAFGQLPSLERLSITKLRWLASSSKELYRVLEKFFAHLLVGDRLQYLALSAVDIKREIPDAASILFAIGKHAPPALRSLSLPLPLPRAPPNQQLGYSSIEWRCSIESLVIHNDTSSQLGYDSDFRHALFGLRAIARLLATGYPNLKTLRGGQVNRCSRDDGRWEFVYALQEDYINLDAIKSQNGLQ